MTKKKLLILGASEMQLPIISRAKELNHYTIVADYNPNAAAFEYADEELVVSTNDTNTLLQIAKDKRIDGILTTSDFPVRTVAIICDTLGLSGPTIDASVLCTDKYKLRQHLKECGFKVPRFNAVNSKETLYDINYYPCVIKPVDSSGSRGVKKVNNIEELIDAYSYSIGNSRNGSVIVEEYIDGDEYSVETLTQKNKTHIIGITEKR